MATRSIHDTLRAKRVLQMQTISAAALNSGDVDTRGFESAMFLVDFGNIDEMGASPQGAAQIAIKLEHADDDGSGNPGSYAAAAAGDVDGLTPDAQGVVATPTSDLNEVTFGYIGSKRFLRVTLTPTGLANGGPVGVWMLNSHAHLSPVTQG